MKNKTEIVSSNSSLGGIDNKLSIVNEIIQTDAVNIYHYAKKYYNIGFNVTCMIEKINEYNKFKKDKYKHPSHKFKHLLYHRQTENEFKSYNWPDAVGVGTVSGFNDIMAIDIDDCNSKTFLFELLAKLSLPNNYEWVTVSGSLSGFHIILRSPKPCDLDEKKIITSYKPNEDSKHIFSKIELLWNWHIILPPSKHKSNNRYSFLNSFPKKSPEMISTDNLVSKVEEYTEPGSKKIGEVYMD